MILAAGYGTRLRPLTDQKPKALVEVNGISLLEIVIKKLIASGVTEIIINTHHLSEQIVAFLKSKNNFGIRVELSHENEILGTGGGLKQASYFFDDAQPFFLHNVDIFSTIDLRHLYQFHLDRNALATLAIQTRESNRYFIVDDQNNICGHGDLENQRIRLPRKPVGSSHPMGFCGIHVISPKIFEFIESSGRFSIVDLYLKLIEKDLPIIGYPADGFYWKDIGKLETLQEIQRDLDGGVIRHENLTF